MQDYKKIIVPIGLQDKDAGAIAWACRIARYTDADDILFIHPYDNHDMPESLRGDDSFTNELLEEIKKLVAENCGSSEEINFRFDVVTGKGELTSLLEAISEQDSDLIVIGKDSFGSSMPVRLARQAPCSVMSVPVECPPKLTKLMVTTDFSKYAKEALEIAVQVAQSRGLKEIESVHVYNLGRQSHKLTIPESTQLEIAADFARERHEEFINDVDLQGVKVNMHNYNNRYVYDALQAATTELGADMIIVSCRGKNALTSWLLGSVAENLLKEANVPVLAAKMRGTGQNFLNVLLGD
ncbi:Nucleotide-binding universal stress protein, UspA family [Rubritalea squalenifaciens DSM 18772]|uniref:Nucleotide-binding universal stress protein, UspA family n=1 Tax=Rubritalea squalenifaciens DSM 18772 TaxID=1123071 RepID=A0A1M6DS38_9BACT|nr:universal stress protein [Rubritalea squalenifaciens]SHI75939.1 Nucleotide-binding universal stress protein, UspA family [Rubritalea squalenifaciens DSM 18772]